MPAPTAKTVTPFHPFTGRDVPWLVDAQAQARPDDVFLVWEPFEGEGASWTFAEFARETLAFAAGLAARGIGKGDFVNIHMDNCPEFIFAWFACSRVGAVAVTTNTRSNRRDLEYYLSHSRCRAAITQPKFAELVRESGPDLHWIACIESDGDRRGSALRPDDLVPFESLRRDPEAAPGRKAEPLSPNSVQYTSGTTSRPKGVVWTHANALWSARTNAAHAGLTEKDVHLFYFPLFHTNALAYSTLATLWSGGKAVMMPRFSASRFWDVARRHGVTWASMVMFTLRAIEEQPDPADHRFRFWALVGDVKSIRERWGIKTIGWFGMTETVSHCIFGEQDRAGPEGAMGRPASEYEISIRRDDGSEVDFNETGRLFIRGIPGLTLFYEYLNDPEATAQSFDEDGWFDTGDEVMPLEDGHIYFVGRAKDMMRVGAENVAAIEIEMVIGSVDGVVENAVVAKADPMLDEVPVAFVVATQPGPELEARIRSACASSLADFKRPREIYFIDELPKGLLDKVLKKELRARLEVPASQAG